MKPHHLGVELSNLGEFGEGPLKRQHVGQVTVNEEVNNRGTVAGHVQAVSGLQRLVELVQCLLDLIHALIDQCLAVIIKNWHKQFGGCLLISDGTFYRHYNFLEARTELVAIPTEPIVDAGLQFTGGIRV